MAKKRSKTVSVGSASSAKSADPFSTDGYRFDDAPKRFQRVLNPHKPSQQKKPHSLAAEGKKKEPSELDVRPSESFKQYNARLGLAATGSKADVGSGKNFKQKLADDFAEARGIRTKRKEHLKQRDAKRRKAEGGGEDSDLEDLVRVESVRFGERAEAPPVIKFKPRNAPKSSLQFKRR